MNPKVNHFIEKSNQWQDSFKKLRNLALSTKMDEDLKWGVPCYTINDKNVLLIHGFKEYCAILFTKGALMKDPNHMLIQQTENVQAARQMRFTNIDQINEVEDIIKSYIIEAINIEKAGLKVELKKETELVYPEEFQDILNQNPALEQAFNQLTPGRKRAYNLFFTAPKQAKTRISRIEKSISDILNGKGLND
jgi:uncharacterized protein YdeI (YjbR/CyaY-like superfamily)